MHDIEKYIRVRASVVTATTTNTHLVEEQVPGSTPFVNISDRSGCLQLLGSKAVA